MKFALLAVTAMTLVTSAASADTVLNTTLQNVNGNFGTSNAQTVTNATGTRTTVTGSGPNAGANRASGAPALNSWYQSSVGAGSTVGITTDHARSGNGSALFTSTQGDPGKGDLVYNFGNQAGTAVAPIALSSLTSLSFDYYRSASSTADPTLAPVLRLGILKDGVFAGTLVFENIYQAQLAHTSTTVPVDTWTTLTADLNNGTFWATNAALGPTFSTAGGQKTLADWLSAPINAQSNLTVYGVEIGIGSGWQGTFDGAVDNVNVNFASRSLNSNFEVAAAAPEPASWAMMVGGFGLIGAAMRRRQRTTTRFA